MPQFKAIIFDMDGTLVDSEVVWEVAEVEMLRERNIVYSDDVRRQVVGLRMDDFLQKLISIYDLPETVEALTEELVNRMLKKISESLQPKHGAREIINWTVSQSIPFCIASSSPMSIIEAAVKSQNWQKQIPQLYTANSVEKGKPAPDIYLYAANQLGVDPEKCLAIEDSPTGAKAAVAAGMTCYVVPDEHTTRNAFDAITPHVFDDLIQILECLKE